MDDPLVSVDGVLYFPFIHLRCHSDGAGGAIDLEADFCGACVRAFPAWRWSRKEHIRSQYRYLHKSIRKYLAFINH
jgi:hypothetical protein